MSNCTERTYHTGRDVMGHECGRPVKPSLPGEPGDLCGQHLAGWRRRQATKAADARYSAGQRAKHASAEAACARLQELGIAATPEYAIGFQVRSGGYTGRVVLDPAELLNKLGER